MTNSAGVVGPAYMTPVDLNFGTATLTQAAQALVDLGFIEDSTATLTPATAGVVGPRHIAPVSADLAVVALADLVDAMESQALLDPVNPAGSVGVDYLDAEPQPATLAAFLTAMENLGIFNNTA